MVLKNCIEIGNVPQRVKNSPVGYFEVEKEIVFYLLNTPFLLYKIPKEELFSKKIIKWKNVEKIYLKEMKKVLKEIKERLKKKDIFISEKVGSNIFYSGGKVYLILLNTLYIFEKDSLLFSYPLNLNPLNDTVLDIREDNNFLWILTTKKEENVMMFNKRWKLERVFTLDLNKKSSREDISRSGKIVLGENNETYFISSPPLSLHKISRKNLLVEKMKFEKKEKKVYIEKIINGNYFENFKIISFLTMRGTVRHLYPTLYFVSPTLLYYTEQKISTRNGSFTVSFIDRKGCLYVLNTIRKFKIFQFQLTPEFHSE